MSRELCKLLFFFFFNGSETFRNETILNNQFISKNASTMKKKLNLDHFKHACHEQKRDCIIKFSNLNNPIAKMQYSRNLKCNSKQHFIINNKMLQ